jgi:MSHA pilin protein MshC
VSFDRRTQRGFTLTELVIVIAIFAILAAVAGPRFLGMGDVAGHFFFDDTLAALRYAQKLAIGTGCVQVTIAANTYTLKLQDNCTGSSYTMSVVHPGTGASGYSNTAPTGVTLTSSASPIIFDALGRALNSGGAVTDFTVTVGTSDIDIVGESGFVDAS